MQSSHEHVDSGDYHSRRSSAQDAELARYHTPPLGSPAPVDRQPPRVEIEDCSDEVSHRVSSTTPPVERTSKRSLSRDHPPSLFPAHSAISHPALNPFAEKDFRNVRLTPHAHAPPSTSPIFDDIPSKQSDEITEGRRYVLVLAKCLLHFGAPSHRIEEMLRGASSDLGLDGQFIYLPGVVIASFTIDDRRSQEVYFAKADAPHVELSSLRQVHKLSRRVHAREIDVANGTRALRTLLAAPPIYSLAWRCVFAFVCAACISPLEFGGSVLDMAVAGVCCAALQWFNLKVAHKQQVLSTVYEMTGALLVSVIARGLSTIPGPLFCYNAIAPASIIYLLPGYAVLIAALEITSENVLCGSVRMVHAVIYTLFLGFSMKAGQQLFLKLDSGAQRSFAKLVHELMPAIRMEGIWNSTGAEENLFAVGNFTLQNQVQFSEFVVEGCYRQVGWPWWRQPVPWWAALMLVPFFSIGKSLSNMQAWRSWHFSSMIAFSSMTWATTLTTRTLLSMSPDIVSFAGAFTLGVLTSVWCVLTGGTGFTTAVTGILFLVPVALSGDEGLDPSQKSGNMRSSGTNLAVRMIEVAVGVTVGLYASQNLFLRLLRFALRRKLKVSGPEFTF